MSNHTIPIYQVIVKGAAHPSWSDWFEGMVMVSSSDQDGSQITTITGAIEDQAALRGLLTRLWDLNICLISIQQIDPPELSRTNARRSSPTSGSVGNIETN